MYYGNIKKSDIANGIGVRFSLCQRLYPSLQGLLQ